MEPLILRGELPEWAASYGNGYGNGNGNGNGNGYGYGYGYGDGDGNGNGNGYGYGYGYGDGDGNGDGYGYGYGDGDGDGSYWRATISYFARQWSDAQRARYEDLRQQGATFAFWKSLTDGRPANGGACEPVQPGTVHTESGPLRNDCGKGQLHATLLPASKWKGDRWWIVAFIGEVRGDDEKLWGLHREILGECL